jgi:ribonuclease HI
MIAGVRPIQITIEQQVQTYMAIKINNLTYDTLLDIRYWRHHAELAIICEVENHTTYTIEGFKDGSKIGDVGTTGIIFVNGKLVHQLKFKLHAYCYNNQAEQVAILKALKKLEEMQEGQDNDRRAALYTDSKITLDLLQNKSKRNRLIESIRSKIIELTHSKWTIHFGWVKGHLGIEGNELVDRLAKAVAVEDGPVVFDKIPKEVIVMRAKENGLTLWQQQWTNTVKGAVTKAFFPSVRNRLRQELPVSPEFTSMVMGHGKLRSSFYRFGIADNLMCPCEEAEDQTTDHLIFRCKKLRNQRTDMIKKIKTAGGNWPMTNETLVNDYLQIFVNVVKSMNFTDL